MKAGLIGLGAMGLGMARNLAKAGLLSAVYNRTESKARDLADELKVNAYTDPAELAQAVDVVLICISADQDVLSVVTAIAPSIKPGTIVIDMSTVSSDTALQAAAILAERQAEFLDAPVSGGVEGAKNGTLVTMVGGEADALTRVRPVLDAMTKRIVHMGPVGMGQATKAVNQIMCAGISQAVTEALAFGRAQGLPMDKVVDVISGGASGNWFLEHRGLTMAQGTFAPGFKLALHHKDLKICQHMAEQSGLAIPLSDKTVKDYEQLMAQGFGDEDISALYRLKRGRE
ncbi:NAD(P)-dependent oxidoreductase [Methylicorpusculum sp.]|uniref:NAD(P)-dependent oxidoreductase n=1 Tax=Methylicorpusculum sp. TaxID=2713644 RepID=UPI00271DB483|nr:NAD(P)-dependent oxidoreductase [Methylicorpusculum sp.]MDO8844387.1 NAD(P)-dependent oxidoreductase [Methylicorpusculum sp.]MDP2176901.1 NAD(P)-dependent oxidoreductase [Methylicorpusculum sp.]MDP3529901.1 NAD(P)-dependent oxidoreductase [Methylicorpusculum sp.]MDZ4153064.1 NAD(P)-dependent oxidoreductase [Methylicorpusculum sp.]